MTRVPFRLDTSIKLGRHEIPCDPDICIQDNQIAKPGITRYFGWKRHLKRILRPVITLRNYWLVDGFIERETGKFLDRYLTDDTVFLEVGCGDMSLRRLLPEKICYNAIDITLSEIHLKRALRKPDRVNIALASATDIPLDDESVSLVVSTEVLEHIPNVDLCIRQIHRVLKPQGVFLVAIPNNYCFKYEKKGKHPEHINDWTFEEFKAYMIERGFDFLHGHMKGLWIPLPLWLTKTSYQLPISSKDEYHNTNFFFAFRKSERSPAKQ